MPEEKDRWADYFAELDPQRRLELFNEIGTTDDPESVFLRKLYQERYQDPRRPGASADTWLWKFVYLPGMYQKRSLSARGFRLELERTLAELHLSGEVSETQARLLYREYRNVARRFLGTCLGKRYGSRLFGLKEASLQEKKELACRDIWRMSRGIALAAGREREMEPFCQALREELAAFDPQYERVYERLEQAARGQKGTL